MMSSTNGNNLWLVRMRVRTVRMCVRLRLHWEMNGVVLILWCQRQTNLLQIDCHFFRLKIDHVASLSRRLTRWMSERMKNERERNHCHKNRWRPHAMARQTHFVNVLSIVVIPEQIAIPRLSFPLFLSFRIDFDGRVSVSVVFSML